MKSNFATAYRLALVHEGGYVNHPADPGGATNKGITQVTYDAYRRSKNWSIRSVRGITEAELGDIYKSRYWDAVHGDDLPGGVDYAVYDFGVNSGPRRAIQFLQRVVGVDDDGRMGPITLAAVRKADAAATVTGLCDARLAWLKRLRHWPTFGRGWSRRVAEVERDARKMVGARQIQRPPDKLAPPPDPEPPQGGFFDRYGRAIGILVVAAIIIGVGILIWSNNP